MIMNTPIPEGCIGRPGLLVAIRRIKGLEDGRLGVVKHAVGWVKDLLDADRRVFAWQVLLTGEPVSVHGHMTQEIIVADACLLPMSQLEAGQVHGLIESQQQKDTDEALAAVRGMLTPEEITSPEFERVMHRAFDQAMLNRALEVVGAEQVLRETGFWASNPPNGQTYTWKAVFDGQEIRMDAAPGMFGDWRFWANSANARETYGGERLVLNEWPRGRVVQSLLELWEDVFGSKRIPEPLLMGWFYRQHQNDIRALEPALPNVHLDGEDLRRALRWLREAYVPSWDLEGPPKDVRLGLEIRDGLLRLSTDLYDIGVAVCRGWIDPCAVSLRQLLALSSATVRGSRLRMECSSQCCLLNGQAVGYWPDLTAEKMTD